MTPGWVGKTAVLLETSLILFFFFISFALREITPIIENAALYQGKLRRTLILKNLKRCHVINMDENEDLRNQAFDSALCFTFIGKTSFLWRQVNLFYRSL